MLSFYAPETFLIISEGTERELWPEMGKCMSMCLIHFTPVFHFYTLWQCQGYRNGTFVKNELQFTLNTCGTALNTLRSLYNIYEVAFFKKS